MWIGLKLDTERDMESTYDSICVQGSHYMVDSNNNVLYAMSEFGTGSPGKVGLQALLQKDKGWKRGKR